MGIQACSQNFQKGGDKIGGPSTTLRGRLSWEVTKETSTTCDQKQAEKETVVQPFKLKKKL